MMCPRVVRILSEHNVTAGYRFLRPFQRLQRSSQVVVNFDQSRCERQRRAEMLHRILMAIKGRERVAEIVVRFGKTRTERESLAVPHDGLAMAADYRQRGAERVF